MNYFDSPSADDSKRKINLTMLFIGYSLLCYRNEVLDFDDHDVKLRLDTSISF